MLPFTQMCSFENVLFFLKNNTTRFEFLKKTKQANVQHFVCKKLNTTEPVPMKPGRRMLCESEKNDQGSRSGVGSGFVCNVVRYFVLRCEILCVTLCVTL